MKLRESAQAQYKSRKEWFYQAENALGFVNELPLAIQELDGSIDVNTRYNDKIEIEEYLSLSFSGGDETIAVLKEHGVTGLELKFSSYSGNYYFENGELPLGVPNVVNVSGDFDPPYECKVIKYTEKVTRYREECEPVASES